MKADTFAELERFGKQCREAEGAADLARQRRDQSIVRAIRAGSGLREVARVVGLSAGTVQRIRDRAEGRKP